MQDHYGEFLKGGELSVLSALSIYTIHVHNLI
jgi:hypothetical protein